MSYNYGGNNPPQNQPPRGYFPSNPISTQSNSQQGISNIQSRPISQQQVPMNYVNNQSQNFGIPIQSNSQQQSMTQFNRSNIPQTNVSMNSNTGSSINATNATNTNTNNSWNDYFNNQKTFTNPMTANTTPQNSMPQNSMPQNNMTQNTMQQSTLQSNPQSMGNMPNNQVRMQYGNPQQGNMIPRGIPYSSNPSNSMNPINSSNVTNPSNSLSQMMNNLNSQGQMYRQSSTPVNQTVGNSNVPKYGPQSSVPLQQSFMSSKPNQNLNVTSSGAYDPFSESSTSPRNAYGTVSTNPPSMLPSSSLSSTLPITVATSATSTTVYGNQGQQNNQTMNMRYGTISGSNSTMGNNFNSTQQYTPQQNNMNINPSQPTNNQGYKSSTYQSQPQVQIQQQQQNNPRSQPVSNLPSNNNNNNNSNNSNNSWQSSRQPSVVYNNRYTPSTNKYNSQSVTQAPVTNTSMNTSINTNTLATSNQSSSYRQDSKSSHHSTSYQAKNSQSHYTMPSTQNQQNAPSIVESFAVPSISALSGQNMTVSSNNSKSSRRGSSSTQTPISTLNTHTSTYLKNTSSTSNNGNSNTNSRLSSSSLSSSYDRDSTSSRKFNSTSSSSNSNSKYGPGSSSAVTTTTYSSSSSSSNRDETRGQKSSYTGRARSRSRSSSKGRTSGTSYAGSKRHASSRSRSPGRSSKSTTNTSSQSTSTKKIDYTSMTVSQLVKEYHSPAIGRFNHSLSVQDLMNRFPQLYIPADFIRIDMDWNSIHFAGQVGIISHISNSASIQLESNPASLPNDSSYPPYASLNDPPKFTYVNPSEPLNNGHIRTTAMILQNSHPKMLESIQPIETNIKPVKFNARVIISLGFKSDNDKVDSVLTRKLRIMVGKRKGNLMLLGGSWSKELDDGDPLVDRNCLENTARRAVLAQSLLDIGDNRYCSLIKMCDIVYHRPQEEFKGKIYPEQDEVTALYLCTVHTPPVDSNISSEHIMSPEEFEEKWQVFVNRWKGMGIGPTIDLQDIDQNIAQYESMILVEKNGSEMINQNVSDTNIIAETIIHETNHTIPIETEKEPDGVIESTTMTVEQINNDNNKNDNVENAIEDNMVLMTETVNEMESTTEEITVSTSTETKDIEAQPSSMSNSSNHSMNSEVKIDIPVESTENHRNPYGTISANGQYLKSYDGMTIYMDEESALGTVVGIIEQHGIEDTDIDAKVMSRDKILREIKTIRGDTWTAIYKAKFGSFPEFISDYSDIFEVDGTKIMIQISVLEKIKRIHSNSYATMTGIIPSSSSSSSSSSSTIVTGTGEETANVVKDMKSTQLDNQSSTATTTTTLNPTNNTVSEAETIARSKPSTPCILLCPPPLPKDFLNDVQKRSDAVTLRIIPLSSVLSYCKDDSNERIFETSVASEVLLSLISVSYANTIADFLLATHETLYYIADPRVYFAVKKLKSSTVIDNVSSHHIEKLHDHVEEEKEKKEEEKEEKKQENEEKEENSKDDNHLVEMKDNSTEDNIESTSVPSLEITVQPSDDNQNDEMDEKNEIDDDKDDDNSDDHATKKMKIDDISDHIDVTEETTVAVVSDSVGAAESKFEIQEEFMDGNAEVKMNEDNYDGNMVMEYAMDEMEAQSWKNSFLSACRWFDVEQSRELRFDHLQLILHSSSRDISRSDITALAWNSCKDEKLRYEQYF